LISEGIAKADMMLHAARTIVILEDNPLIALDLQTMRLRASGMSK